MAVNLTRSLGVDSGKEVARHMMSDTETREDGHSVEGKSCFVKNEFMGVLALSRHCNSLCICIFGKKMQTSGKCKPLFRQLIFGGPCTGEIYDCTAHKSSHSSAPEPWEPRATRMKRATYPGQPANIAPLETTENEKGQLSNDIR